MNEPILLARLAGRRIALIARDIEAIVEINDITPVPMAPAHVEGLSTLRSKALTVINGARVLGQEDSARDTTVDRKAAVIVRDGHHYALLLDEVEDVVEAQSEPQSVLGGVGEEWSQAANGVVETATGPVLLVKVEPFINVKPLAA